MELSSAGIAEQPFRTHGKPLAFVSYQGQVAASQFLASVYRMPHALGLFQGPSLSGKTTIIHHFLETALPDNAAVAFVDGKRLDARSLLERVLRDFGFDIHLDSASELMNLLRVFSMQQTASHAAPLIVVEHTHALQPDALQVLCDLTQLRVSGRSALRLRLTDDRPMSTLINAPAMECICKRVTGTFDIAPMDGEETAYYVYSKLRAGGCDTPERVVPDEICEELYAASGGWPGIVDRLMLLALARAEALPLAPAHIERPVVPARTGESGLRSVGNGQSDGPKLFLTYHGRTLREIPLDRPRMMIGRSEHNDIPISSRFISRHHALFIRDGDTTLLMDLNSTNGTFVNSQRVSNHIMVHDDVVNLGHHGLKFSNPSASRPHPLEGANFNETVIMKSLDDMRQLLARENTQLFDFADTGSGSD